MSAEELERVVDLLVRQVAHWTAPRWSVPASPDGRTRADLTHQLVQKLADLAADAEGEPHRMVPRLESDLALPDQLRVVAADLLAAEPATGVLVTAVDEVRAIRRILS